MQKKKIYIHFPYKHDAIKILLSWFDGSHI